MAVLNFSITIPDAEVPRSAEAVKAYFKDLNMSDAAAIEALRQEYIARFEDIVSSYWRLKAIQAAETANYGVGAS